MNRSTKKRESRSVLSKLLLGALGGTVIFGGVLFLFAMAVGADFWRSLVAGGWDGSARGMAGFIGTFLGSQPGLTFLGFSLFGGVIGVALAGRDARIQAEVDTLRRTREDLLETLLSSERFATMGEMAAEIGHEINNYLAIARAQLELFAHTVEDSVNERAQRYIQSLTQQLVRMHRMSRGLMGFWGERQAREQCDLNRIVRETIEFVTPLDRFDEVRFSMDLASDFPLVMVDSQQIQQVLLNLFNNAADALRGRSGRIRVTSCHWAEEDLVEIVISDNGPGIHPTVLDRVFEPGFTTRADGHGYGLAVCKRIVEQHSARLSVQSEPGKGTTFVLSIPASVPAAADFDEESEFDVQPAEYIEEPIG